ncbi:MAG: HAMP domain-containing histidine kinase [Synergistetes bacterium]|nr:HAMP domain-containing histidine kinase [Synergistota bacterium]MDW8191796.1 HAMP domain-containing sensor histidine kinase [Synergistota bacterium]
MKTLRQGNETMELLSSERISLGYIKILTNYFEEHYRDLEIIASVKESWLPFAERRLNLTEGLLEILRESNLLEKRFFEAFHNLKRAFLNLKRSITNENLQECVRLVNYILSSLRELTQQKEGYMTTAMINFTKALNKAHRQSLILFSVGIPVILLIAYLIVIESRRMNLTLINYLRDIALKIKSGSFPIVTYNPLTRLPEGERLAIYINDLINQVNESVKRINELSEARTSFLAIASHELKTPLTSIIGYSEILLERENLSQEEKRALSIINSQAHKLSNTIERMLIYSTLDSSINLEEIDLREIILKLQQEVKAKIDKKRLTFKINMPEKRLSIRSDPYRVDIALREILDNAIKFTEEGEITLTVKDDEEYIIIEVEDSGPGIKEKREIIFELFAQGEGFLKRKHEGIGLGLPLALRALSGIGNLSFESKEKGSKFCIKILKRC